MTDTRQPRATRETRNRVTPPYNMTGSIAPGEDEQKVVTLLGDKTECLELPLYNRYDVPSLLEGYNPAMEKLDAWACEKNAKDEEQDKRLDAVEAKNKEQDTRLDAIEEKDREQDGRLDAIEEKNTEQDSRLDAIEAEQTEQNDRLDAIEEKNTQQDELLSGLRTDVDANTTKNATQDSRLDKIEAKDTEQDEKLSAIDTEQDEQDQKIEDLTNRVQTIEDNPYELPISTEDVLGGVKMVGTHLSNPGPLGAYNHTTGEYSSRNEMFKTGDGETLGWAAHDASGDGNTTYGDYYFYTATDLQYGVVKIDGTTIKQEGGVIRADVSGGVKVEHVAMPFSSITQAESYLALNNILIQQGFDFIGNSTAENTWEGYTTFRLSFVVAGDVTDDNKIGFTFTPNYIISGDDYLINLLPSINGNSGTATVKRYISTGKSYYYNAYPCSFTKEGTTIVVNFEKGDNAVVGERPDINTSDVVFIDFKIWSELRYVEN